PVRARPARSDRASRPGLPRDLPRRLARRPAIPGQGRPRRDRRPARTARRDGDPGRADRRDPHRVARQPRARGHARAPRRRPGARRRRVADRKNGDDGEGGRIGQRRVLARSRAMRVATFLALSIVLSAAALAEPPKVDVRFVIEAQQFVDGLQGSRASVERALTQTLLDECRDQKSFPFVKWSNGDAAATNRLVVALVQRRAGSDFEMLIEYRGTIKGGAMAPALQEVVYRWFEAKYADTAEVVKARLQKRLRDQFANEPFRKSLLRYFVSQVPLAETVDIDVPGHRVIVPVAAMNLQADEQQSELAVAF